MTCRDVPSPGDLIDTIHRAHRLGDPEALHAALTLLDELYLTRGCERSAHPGHPTVDRSTNTADHDTMTADGGRA